MDYFIFFSCVALGTLTSLISKVIKKSSNSLCVASATNTATFFVAMVTILVIGVCFGENPFADVNAVPFALAVLYGLCVMLAQFSFLLAVGRGSVAISTLFYSCGFVIPTFYGILILKEPTNPIQIVGVALIVVAFVLSTDKQQEDKRFDIAWLIFALGGLLFSGGIGVVQKQFGLTEGCSVNIFIFYSFVCAFVLNLVLTVILFAFFKDKLNKADNKQLTTAFASALILGAIMGLANKLNTYVAGVFPSVKTFPVVNGGRIVLTTLLGAIFFKEKISLKQKIGIIIGFVAISMIAYK